MADEQKPEGAPPAPPSGGEAEKPPVKPAADAAKPAGEPTQSAAESAKPLPSKPAEAAKPASESTPPAAESEKPAPPKPAAAAKPAGESTPAAGDAGKPVPPKPAAAKPAAPAAGHAAPPKAPAVMAATPWESELAKEIKERFGDRIVETSTYLGQNFIVSKPDAAVALIEYLKLEADFDYLVDVTAVDWPKRPERFDVVYVLYSFARNERVRVKIYIKDGFKPETVVSVHLTANWLEREVFDMFGIEFDGHPDMRRILLPEEWQGFPLRKEYGIIQQDDRWVQENLNIESGQ